MLWLYHPPERCYHRVLGVRWRVGVRTMRPDDPRISVNTMKEWLIENKIPYFTNLASDVYSRGFVSFEKQEDAILFYVRFA